jgi:carboxyl-terminal processing protease
MKWKVLSIVVAFVASANAVTFAKASPPLLEPLPHQIQTAQLAAGILKQFPYRAISFDATSSERIFEHYLKALDPEKIIFVQADIDAFGDARRALGAETEQGDLRHPFSIFRIYASRAAERMAYARELLKEDFDFTTSERFPVNRDKAPFAASDDEVRDLWRKRVKNDWLQLELAGKDAPAIRAELDKRYAKLAHRIANTKSNDVFKVYMDAVATAVDPHTDYFAPAEAANFEISMKLSLFGIGAVLHDKDEYVTIREIMPGGPAALSALKTGDRIVAVGQGTDGSMIDVVGMRLEEVVDLIRGPENTTVRLDVLPADAGPDGKRELVTLVRNKISVEQQAAKKSVITTGQGDNARRVGIISLPAFYQDFDARRKGDKDFRSATRDVLRLLMELKSENVDGVLIDLRNNGGGSLEEAVALTGLFIGTGPVVQERNAQGQVRVDSSTRPLPLWEGPMGILINRGSASASEIFAAAIQDHGRGAIIGESSYGKGTVQTIIDLDRIAQNDKPQLGELKMTIAQFFRVNGGTTQLRGVVPDIGFPPISDMERIGESSFDNALPWAKVKPAGYARAGGLGEVLPVLKQRHASRVAQDKDFQYLVEDIAELKAQRKAADITLNEAERMKERSMREARIKSRDATDSTSGVATKPAKDSKDAEPSKDPKDVWLIEAARIVADEAELLGPASKYAAGMRSGTGENVE